MITGMGKRERCEAGGGCEREGDEETRRNKLPAILS